MTISALFLDTEHTEASFRHLARALRDSGFSVEELDRIYGDVAASLYMNTYAVAGVWDGFDVNWVMEKVAKNSRSNRSGLLASMRRFLVTRSTIESWRELRALIEVVG